MTIIAYCRPNWQASASFRMPTRKNALVQFGLAFLSCGDSTLAALFTVALQREGLGDG